MTELLYEILEKIESGPVLEFVKHKTGRGSNSGAYEDLLAEIKQIREETRKAIERIEETRIDLSKVIESVMDLLTSAKALLCSIKDIDTKS